MWAEEMSMAYANVTEEIEINFIYIVVCDNGSMRAPL